MLGARHASHPQACAGANAGNGGVVSDKCAGCPIRSLVLAEFAIANETSFFKSTAGCMSQFGPSGKFFLGLDDLEAVPTSDDLGVRKGTITRFVPKIRPVQSCS